MNRIFIFLFLLSTCSGVCADIARFTPPDPRLDKKIMLDVNYAKLEDVAKTLSDQSGTVIKAGTGERDWKARERRVTIHVKDMTVGNLLDKTAALLGFCLSREGKNKEWSYVIWQDKKGRDLEAEMLTAEKEAEAQRIAKQRQAGIDLAKEALDMSPEDAMKQKAKDPLLAYLGGTKSGRGYAQFLSSFGANFPTEYDLMMRGKRAYFPMSALPPNMQQALRDATSGGLSGGFKALAGKDISPFQMVMTPATDLFSGASDTLSEARSIGLMVVTGAASGENPDANGWMGGGNLMGLCPLIDGSTPLGKFAGQTQLDAESGAPIADCAKQIDDALKNPDFIKTVEARESPTEKKPPTDPDLTREVEIKDLSKDIKPGTPGEKRLGIIMAELSRATGYPILLEAFRKPRPVDMYVRPGKQPLYKALIGLEKAGYTWIKDDDKTIRIRPEDWAFRRSCEIPLSCFKATDAVLLKQGCLALDDVAGFIARLTDDQIQTQLSDEPFTVLLMGRVVQDGAAEREMLRVYALCTPQQKAALTGEGGLPFAQMTDDQWGHVSDVLADRMSGRCIADGSVRLLPQTDEQIQARELARTFEISALGGDQKEIATLNVLIPLASADRQAAEVAKMTKAREDAAKAQAETPAAAK